MARARRGLLTDPRFTAYLLAWKRCRGWWETAVADEDSIPAHDVLGDTDAEGISWVKLLGAPPPQHPEAIYVYGAQAPQYDP